MYLKLTGVLLLLATAAGVYGYRIYREMDDMISGAFYE